MYKHKGEESPAYGEWDEVPGAYRQGDKGPIPRDKEKKGRDASGASSGAEALIAAPFMLNYECFRV